jgi:hypothetical protein
MLLQIALIPNCKVQRKIGDYYLVLEQVSKDGVHMKEDVTRVHVVCLAGFQWKDCDTNVVPTCTCPANINVKDCCAGIMKAIGEHPKFTTEWYNRTWYKKELLHPRHRLDCDPFLEIANILDQQCEPRPVIRDAEPRPPRTKLVTPDAVEIAFKLSLQKAGNDQFLVSRPLFGVYSCVHKH